MSLPLPRLDDRTWQDLRDEGVSLIPSNAPMWTDFNVTDPGITLIELLAYHTELELFRLDCITTSHRHAYLKALGHSRLLSGPQPAATLLILDPTLSQLELSINMSQRHVKAGEYFVPRGTAIGRRQSRTASDTNMTVSTSRFRKAGEPDEPMLQPSVSSDSTVPEFGFRAAHEFDLTGIRIAALQSFDGTVFRDISNPASQSQLPTVWGDNPTVATDQSTNEQPAFYIGLNLAGFDWALTDSSNLEVALTLWYVPNGFGPADLRAATDDSSKCRGAVRPPKPLNGPTPSGGSVVRFYDPDQTRIKTHHGLTVRWEYFSDNDWTLIPSAAPFRDETCGFSSAGRIVFPKSVLKDGSKTSVGIIPAEHVYIRCRLIQGRPDSAPAIRGLYADAVLVEQWDESATKVSFMPPERMSDLQLLPEIEADVRDSVEDLSILGWGWTADAWKNWPLWGGQGFQSARKHANPPLDEILPIMNAIVIGVSTGEPNQRFSLPCPTENTLFAADSVDREDDGTSIRVMTDTLRVWSLEPPWAWTPSAVGRLKEAQWQVRYWDLVHDLAHDAGRVSQFLYDPTPAQSSSRYAPPGQIVFGDGENGWVPAPGSIIVASYRWTITEGANFAANFIWAMSTDRERFHADRVTQFPTLRFLNPLPAEGGKTDERLPSALRALANEFAAPANLIEFADNHKTNTLDGLDITEMTGPAMAVSLLDFECLARKVPETDVVRSRAWAEFDPAFPGYRVPGAISVTIVPSIPADRPEPTAGLIERVKTFLEARRPMTCRLSVVGPDYVAVRIRATLHTSVENTTKVREDAIANLNKYLHPTRGGQTGRGWPFGRDVRAGELMRILANVGNVKYVTGLQVAGADGLWTDASVSVPQRSLVNLVDVTLEIRGGV